MLSTVVEQELLQPWLIDFTDTLCMLTDVTEESCWGNQYPGPENAQENVLV